MQHPRLLLVGTALVLTSTATLAQRPQQVRQIEALVENDDYDAVLKGLAELGADPVPGLLTLVRGSTKDAEGMRFGGRGGRFAGGRKDAMAYARVRPEQLGELVRPRKANRSWGTLDSYTSLGADFCIHDAGSWREWDVAAMRAAHLLSALPRKSALHLEAIGKALDDVGDLTQVQLCHSLGKIGRPAAPLLIAKTEELGHWPLCALWMIGPGAARDILVHLKETDPAKSGWQHAILWALLDRTEDPILQRRSQREALRWINRSHFRVRMYLGEKLAEYWAEQPENFVETMRGVDNWGRYTLVQGMVSRDGALSASTAVVLLAMMRDGDRDFAPGILGWFPLEYASEESAKALGHELANLIPGQPFDATMVFLRLAEKLGKHAEPLRPWLLAYREHGSPRMSEAVERVLASIEGGQLELAADRYPGLVEAWRAAAARILASRGQAEFGKWRARLAEKESREAALGELGRDDSGWSVFLENELEQRYVLPRSPTVRLSPPPVPAGLDHAGAKRWLEGSRVLPANALDVHRGFVKSSGVAADAEAQRIWLCRALGRFVAEAPWPSNWDAHKLVALLDADDPELRKLALELVERFTNREAPATRVERIAFPQRHPELLRAVAKDAAGHANDLFRVMRHGDEQQRMAAYLVLLAAHREDAAVEAPGFSILSALDDWHDGIATTALELLQVLPKGHALLEEFGFSDWLVFGRMNEKRGPAIAARKLLAVTEGAVPDWVRIQVADWLLEHPLPRYALLQYLKKLGEHAAFMKPKLVALRATEAAKDAPDAALLEDIDAVLRAVK